jgi:hypothetical protein
LVLSLDDDGLEDLTLRLVLPEYPKAHRTYRGPDGGIDVFSDYDVPSERAWQCKNYIAGSVSWDKCRNSLKTALEEPDPPSRYTFVFPRALKKSDHDYWLKTFVPWAQGKFGQKLPSLDYWDNLADCLQGRPDLVDLLNDGALGTYVRNVLEKTAAEGVNPLAGASDLLGDPAQLAERAKTIGKNDPYFAYGLQGREVSAADEDLPANQSRFTLDRTHEDQLPRFAVAVRDGEGVREVTALPRAGTPLRPIRVVFAEDEDGRAILEDVRIRLSKGLEVTLNDSEVTLNPGTVPDRFRRLLDEKGQLRGGELRLGPSDPLTLEISMTLGETTALEEVQLHRIPELPGVRVSWGGSVCGAILLIDLRPVGEGDDVEIVCSVVNGFAGETPERALHGVGFLRAFAAAGSTHLKCDGLLNPGGVDIESVGDPESESQQGLIATAFVAAALAQLELRDPRGRKMPVALSWHDVETAMLVLELFQTGESRDAITETDNEFEVPVPIDAQPTDDPQRWMQFATALPSIVGHPTLSIEVSVEGASPLRIGDADDGQRVLVCRNDGGAVVVMRLAESEETPRTE